MTALGRSVAARHACAIRPELAVADLAGQRRIRQRVPEVRELVEQRQRPQMRVLDQPGA